MPAWTSAAAPTTPPISTARRCRWDWGDGTVSENSEDCDPYEEGTSAIRRRFSANHTFQQGGAYRVTFRLKQKTRVIASASTNVQVRAGVRDDFGR